MIDSNQDLTFVTIKELRAIIKNLDPSLAFKQISQNEALLFSFYKLVYNQNRNLFELYRRKLTSPNEHVWVRIKNKNHVIFRLSEFFWEKGKCAIGIRYVFDKVSEEAIKTTIMDLMDIGVRVKDTLECTRIYPTEDPEFVKYIPESFKIDNGIVTKRYGLKELSYQYPYEFTCTNKSFKSEFISDTDGNLVLSDNKFNLLHVDTLESITANMFYTGRKVYSTEKKPLATAGWFHAEKAFGQWVRSVASKEWLTIMGKVFWNKGFRDWSLGHYNYVVSRKISSAAGNLLLYFQLPSFTIKAMKSFDYSNKSFLNLLQGCDGLDWLTKSDLRVLRKIPPIVMRHFFEDTKNAPRIMTIKRALFFFRKDLISFFPSTVISYLVKNIKSTSLNINYDRIITQWMLFYKMTYINHGYNKHKGRWRQHMDELLHVCDFIEFSDDDLVIQKNQTWHSILEQASRWQYERTLSDGRENLIWKPSAFEEIEIDGVFIRELTSSHELITEGYQMNHCVGNYDSYCSGNAYRVYSLQCGGMRATLGLNMDSSSHRVRFDQLRSFCNGQADKALIDAANRLIENLNAVVKEAA